MKETLADFYKHHAPTSNQIGQYLEASEDYGNFNVYRRGEFTCRNSMASHRRDFYKISLIQGTGLLHYADRGIEIGTDALLFSNPGIPYAWEATSSAQRGYFCVFKENFVIRDRASGGLIHSPLFSVGTDPVFFLTEAQTTFLSEIFEKMLHEINSTYAYRYELLRNYVHLILHEAMKMQPNHRYFQHGSNAAERITHLFTELLERQFPIDSIAHRLSFRSPADFASRLSVHVNHLNRSVKKVTGKTTQAVINRRIIEEAQALLTNTLWNISEVAYCLGFDEPSYFSNFFKKHTAQTPAQFRRQMV